MRALYWYSKSVDDIWIPLPEDLADQLDSARKYRDHLPIIGQIEGKKVKIASFEVLQMFNAPP